jgi:putative membrane protein
MKLVANLAVGLVALIHVFVGIIEMFFWVKPFVHERLRPKVVVNEDEARRVAPIVANVGLYNWFLASGLIWTLLPSNLKLLPEESVFPVQVFFLGCVMVAGVYGALTVSVKTLVIQTAFATAALLSAWLAKGY